MNDSCQVNRSIGPAAVFFEEGTSHSCCCIHLRWNFSANHLVCSLTVILGCLLSAGCAELDATEQDDSEEVDSAAQAATALLQCGGAGLRVVDQSLHGSEFPQNVVDGGTQIQQQWMSKTPGYAAKEYDTKEAAEADLPEVCASFGSAQDEALKTLVGQTAKDACTSKLFNAFACEQCENGAGDKCEKEIRQGSCEWRAPGGEPTVSVSVHIATVEPRVDPNVRLIVPPRPVVSDGPAPGTKYVGDCLLTASAAAQITDNLVGCGEANSCD